MPIEPHNDGLIIPEVGPWAKRKYHFLGRYLDAFTNAMKGKKWDGLYYIDPFCGAGLARIRDSEEIVLASPLLAANIRNPFTRLHLCDANPDKIDACRRRLEKVILPNRPHILTGDSNETIDNILDGVSPHGLSVAFIDPFNLGGIAFETIRAIANYNSDLIILLPDHIDAIRNATAYYGGNPESNLDRFLGIDWRKALTGSDSESWIQKFRELYEQQLRKLRYRHFDAKRVRNTHNRPLYLLLYASRHPAGLKIWRGIGAIDEKGQRELFQ